MIALAAAVIPLDLLRKGVLALLHPKAQEPDEEI